MTIKKIEAGEAKADYLPLQVEIKAGLKAYSIPATKR